MSRARGSAAVFFLKWMVIPVGLAAVGFYVVAPRLTTPPLLAPPIEREAAPVVDDSTPKKHFGEPEVSISSTKASSPSESRRRPRRRTRTRTAPRTSEPSSAPSTAPAPSTGDVGHSDG